jgi:hypothetical protein
MAKHISLAFIFLFVLVFSFESCKKTTTPNGKVKGETYRHQFSDTTFIDTLSYSYDQQGRVVVIQHVKGKETYVFSGTSYTYTPVSGTPITGILNSEGLVTSTSDGQSYSYDNNGYLISDIDSILSRYYTISDGNILVDSQANNGHSSIQYFTYSTMVDYRDFGTPIKGRQNHNLTLRDSIRGNQESTIISYTFDSKSRVSTETISGKGILFTNTYSYFD